MRYDATTIFPKIRDLVHRDKTCSSILVERLGKFLALRRQEDAELDAILGSKPLVFYRDAWKAQYRLARGIAKHLRESSGMMLIAVTTSIDPVSKMTGLANRARENGALGCVIFTAQCQYGTQDFRRIQSSAIDRLFLTSAPNYGAPYRCPKIVTLSRPARVATPFDGARSCSLQTDP